MAVSFAKRSGIVVCCALAGSVSLLAALPGAKAPLPVGKGVWQAFEPNLGQGPEGAAFVARSPRAFLAVGRRGVELYLASPRPFRPGPEEGPCPGTPAAAVRLRLEGETSGVFRPEDPLPGVVHLYRGHDPARWVTGVPRYGRLLWEGARPGVDVEFFPLEGAVRFDLLLSPGADAGGLRLLVESLDGAPAAFRQRPGGEVAIETAAGSLPLHLPAVFAVGPEGRRSLRGSFVLLSPRSLGIRIEGRKEGEALVVDPTLVYSSYLGGSQYDAANDFFEDGAGNLAVAGYTYSLDFPGGATFHGLEDAFLAVFQGPGHTLGFVALLGGYDADSAAAVATDDGGRWYLTGETHSADFPVVNGLGSGAGAADAFLSRFTSSGMLDYSTKLGGYGFDSGRGLDTSPLGYAFVAGMTDSADFPTTPNAPQLSIGGGYDGFFTVLEPDLGGTAALLFSTFVGGSGTDTLNDVRADPANAEAVFLCGQSSSLNFPHTPDAFQPAPAGANDGVFLRYVKNPTPGPTYATFLGGGQDDELTSLAVLSPTSVGGAGYTLSGDFPLSNPTQSTPGGGTDGVVALFDLASTPPTLDFSTYLGGSGQDYLYAAAPCGLSALLVAGATDSTNLPLLDPLPGQEALKGIEDALLAGWDFSGTLPQRRLTTYFGGGGDDYAEALFCRVDSTTGETRWGMAGGTSSTDFPLAGSPFQGSLAGSGDAFFSLFTQPASVCTVTCTASSSVTEGEAPLWVVFNAAATPQNCNGSPSYAWDFGDGGSATGPSAGHTYAAPGTYTWTLTVTVDSATCTRTGTVQVCELTCAASAPPVLYTGEEGTFSMAPDFGPCNPGTYSYTWVLGDGAILNAASVTHAYSLAGTYHWAAYVSASAPGNPSCQQEGDVAVCALSCTASASPASGTAPLAVAFSGAAALEGPAGVCTPNFAYSWTFGDGGTSTAQNPTHTYTAPGTYTWTLTVTNDGRTATQTGVVAVSAPSQGLFGFVGIQESGGEFFPLDGNGVVELTVTARNTATGQVTTSTAEAGFFSFPGLPAGDYTLKAHLRYRDFVLHSAERRAFGCPAPTTGVLFKEVERALSDPVHVETGASVYADIPFPPPLVFLHGLLDCYKKWYSDDPQDPDRDRYWDNASRAEGLITFTPNYAWWGDESTWPEKASQVFEQVALDMRGLHFVPLQTTTGAFPPWTIVAHDLGGLVARVLSSGELSLTRPVEALRSIVLLGVPNSGSDLLLGGLGNDLVSEEAIVRRFNEVYPDFGTHTGDVYAVGGNQDWWHTGRSDGRVSLYSAFVVTRLACSPTAFGTPSCRPYPALVFENGPGHIFPFGHADLGSPPSTAAILQGVLLPLAETLGPSPAARRRAAAAPDDENPLSPVGQSIWGTGARSTGTKGGTVNGFAGLSVTQTFPFTVGATDGVALSVFVSDGAGTFTLTDPQGTPVASTSTDEDFLWSLLDPAPGTWTLAVSVPSGSVTFRATSFENSPLGIRAYLTKDRYAPGEQALLRLDLEGEPGDLALSAVSADILSGGSLLQTVPLYDDGLHDDGQAGDGSYGGTTAAPSEAGAYTVLFRAQGTYGQKSLVRIARDTLFVLPPVHAFTGAFADTAADTDGDGLFDAVVLSAGLNLPSAGDYALSADLYDADGHFLAHGTEALSAAAPGAVTAPLSFPLPDAPCASFGRPFAVQNLRLLEGGTLRPLDGWTPPVPTAAYGAADFECSPAPPGPRIQALHPDEAPQGLDATVLVSGENFLDGAALDLGGGVAVHETTFLSERALTARITVSPTAALGPRTATVTNPGGASAARPAAFSVKADDPPSVALLSPEASYVVLETAPLPVTAQAGDDVRVARVVFLVDGTAAAEVAQHPFTWNLDPASLATGAHTVTARAYDNRGQSAEASFLAVKDPPAITAVTKMASPFRIKILGRNFQQGAQVYLGNDTTPWPYAKVKNTATVILKGGAALKAKFPKGQAVAIRLVNPDGGWCTGTYTRP